MPRIQHKPAAISLLGLALASFLVAFLMVTGFQKRAPASSAAVTGVDSRALSIVDPQAPPPTIDTATPFWYEPYVEADARAPRAPVDIAGLTVGVSSHSGTSPCPEASLTVLQANDLTGPDWNARLPRPHYLPIGARLDHETAFLCEGQLVWYSTGYTLPADDAQLKLVAAGRASWFDVAHGGFVEVTLLRTREPAVSMAVPAARLATATINSSMAAVAAPVLKAGFGEAFAATYDGQALVKVSTMHLPISELIRIAEGVMK